MAEIHCAVLENASCPGTLLAVCETCKCAFAEQGSATVHALDNLDALSDPPSSPRLRQSTFGATLDFIEALCDASSGLTAFAPVRLLPAVYIACSSMPASVPLRK